MLDLGKDLIGVLTYLAPGYLAFSLYAVEKEKVRQETVFFIALIYAIISNEVFGAAFTANKEFWGDKFADLLHFIAAIISAIFIAILWKTILSRWITSGLRKLGVTNEDNNGTCWDYAFYNPNIYITQISVTLLNGYEYRLDDAYYYAKFLLRNSSSKNLVPYYFSRGDSLAFIPSEFKRAGETEWRKIDPTQENGIWGVQWMIFPLSQISDVTINCIDSEHAELWLSAR